MNKLFKIALGLIAGVAMFTSCNDDDDVQSAEFSIDKTDITVGPEGGSEAVTISSGSEWTAVSNVPWVSILTSTGVGVKQCEVAIDTTLIEGIREAKICIMNREGEMKYIDVHQTGFGNVLSLAKPEETVEATGEYGKRYFDAKITTNVVFRVEIDEASKSWLSYDEFTVNLDQKKRPKTMNIRFNWTMNTDPVKRVATVKLISTDGSEMAEAATLTVTQDAAPKITDDRAGDSLAVLMMIQKMGINTELDASENMKNWDLVTLWEKKDEEVKDTPGMIGRIRSVSFTMMNTKEDIPSEVSHLKYLETFYAYGNSNRQLRSIELGDQLSGLKYLKNLTINSYGLISLPQSLANLKQLESLNISSNNFKSFPSVVTKTNFPNLKKLSMSDERLKDYVDLSTIPADSKSDYGMVLERQDLVNLFNWSNLEQLVLTLNLIEGELPTMENECEAWWSGADIAANDTLANAKSVLLGKPKILPKCKSLYLNLNYLTGNLPDWILYHPYLSDWDPYTLVFSQEGLDSNGKKSGFDNEPLNLNYYYELYPLKKPHIQD